MEFLIFSLEYRISTDDSQAYHDAVCMVLLMIWCNIFAGQETWRTYVYAVSLFTDWVRTFYTNRMREVAVATVALNLQARFIDSYKVRRLRKQTVRNCAHGRRRGPPLPASTRSDNTHFVFPQVVVAACGELWSSCSTDAVRGSLVNGQTMKRRRRKPGRLCTKDFGWKPAGGVADHCAMYRYARRGEMFECTRYVALRRRPTSKQRRAGVCQLIRASWGECDSVCLGVSGTKKDFVEIGHSQKE